MVGMKGLLMLDAPMILKMSTGRSFSGAESMLSEMFRNHPNVTAITSLHQANQGGDIEM